MPIFKTKDLKDLINSLKGVKKLLDLYILSTDNGTKEILKALLVVYYYELIMSMISLEVYKSNPEVINKNIYHFEARHYADTLCGITTKQYNTLNIMSKVRNNIAHSSYEFTHMTNVDKFLREDENYNDITNIISKLINNYDGLEVTEDILLAGLKTLFNIDVDIKDEEQTKA